MSEERQIAIQIEDLVKTYRIGAYNSRTFLDELQTKRARRKGKEDPHTKIGQNTRLVGTTLYALNHVSATIYQGETIGVIGPNGSGKSTLLKLISNITIPTEGQIGINGRISSMLEVGVGFMPEMTGKENIYLNGAILGMSSAEVDAKLDKIIEFSECKDFIDTPIKRYSSGMRLKLAFSIAAHLDNEIMIMDEILAVGDQAFQRKCLDRMLDASVTEGKTVLYVSHNMATIRQLCSRCIVLEQGKVIFDGDTEHAIDVYCKKNAVAACEGDLTDAPRNGKVQRRLHIERFRVPDRSTPQFTRGEKLTVELTWRAEVDVPRAFPVVQVFTADSEPLGVAFAADAVSGERDGRYVTSVTLDTSMLAIGEYLLSFGFIAQFNSYTNRIFLDNVDRCFRFEMRPDAERDVVQQWRPQIDGSLILPTPTVTNVKEGTAHA